MLWALIATLGIFGFDMTPYNQKEKISVKVFFSIGFSTNITVFSNTELNM